MFCLCTHFQQSTQFWFGKLLKGIIDLYLNAWDLHFCPGANGAIAAVSINKAEVFRKSFSEGDSAGVSLNLRQSISKGDLLYFIIESNGDQTCDTTGVTLRISLEKQTENPIKPFIKYK
jgi:hypothetical protein